jgi:eukaryotic-like serine/threonine-protein kinase
MVEPLAGRETLNIGDATAAQFYASKALAIAEALASSDRNNVQAQNDLGFGYQAMGDALRLVRPAIAERWYRKSLTLAKEMVPRYPAGSLFHEALAYREEALAAELVRRDHALERLKLLQDASRTWMEVSAASPGKVEYRLSLMRSYCRLSDAELALNDLAKAQEYVDSTVPFFNEFKPDSNSLLVLRDLGLCYKTIGNVQRRIASDQSLSASDRRAAETKAHQWYLKSADVWNGWVRRGAATPESEVERRKVERLLQTK